MAKFVQAALFVIVILATGSIIGSFPFVSPAQAVNANLFVSAENSSFNNRVSGPQIIEVVVRDQNISDTGKGLGEPDVTVNGKDFRMIQATDGNWYGYFADRKQAQIADGTVGLPGKGLDFGTFCSRDTSVLGFSVSDSEGVAIPVHGSGIGGENGAKTPDPISDSCSFSSPYTTGTMNVVRQAKTINQGSGSINLGQIGLASQDLWPFVQLYDFSKGGNIIVQYNRGGGPQQTTLTFDTAEKSINFNLDRSSYPRSSDVNIRIADLNLNIDPTSEDSWSFGTNPSNPSTYYMLYESSGKADADGTDGAVNLIPTLSAMMFKENGILKINPSTQGQSNVVTIKDNADSQTNGDGEKTISDVASNGSSLSSGSQPITLTETEPKSVQLLPNQDLQN